MAHIRIPKGWEIPERLATPEHRVLDRRAFLATLGVAALGTASRPQRLQAQAAGGPYPAKRNPAYALDRPITDEFVVTRYNNFYEFSAAKNAVQHLATRLRTDPWTIEVSGLVHKPQTFDVWDLVRRMPLEERLYRLRCIEAWSMAVPWTGLPLKSLIDMVEPMSSARFVRLVSFLRPDEAPNQRLKPSHPWPHAQGLTLAEATNELSFLATGMYGHELPKQNGAPIRLVVPWKYGFKSLKSIVAIEFTATQPHTFWTDIAPHDYHFTANVDPSEHYQGNSQATEQDIGTGDVHPTFLYNGYGVFVAHLYEKSSTK
ncbi:MAG: protein-methionine-sulfoxide reductase catalytic subunit MsrP [Terriglobia bacterium]